MSTNTSCGTIEVIPGDELHLTMLMAPMSLNFLVASDRQDLLAYAKSVWQASRMQALAETEHKVTPLTISGYQLREALEFLAPDGIDEQLEQEVCIQHGPERTHDEGTDPEGLYCWLEEYPEEGAIALTGEPLPPTTPMQQGAGPVARVKRLTNCSIIDSTGCTPCWEDLPDGTALFIRPPPADHIGDATKLLGERAALIEKLEWAAKVGGDAILHVGGADTHKKAADMLASDVFPVQEQTETPTKGMTLPQRILHVGGRNNEAGYVEFGSVQAVQALVRHVLRDMQNTSPQTLINPTDAVRKTEFSQFLSDVLTAAGLVEHGRQCKALGTRLSEGVTRYIHEPQPPQTTN